MVIGVDAGQERGSGRPGVRRDRGAEDLTLALVEERLEVGQAPCSSRGRGCEGSRMRQSAPSHAIRITRDIRFVASLPRNSSTSTKATLSTPSLTRGLAERFTSTVHSHWRWTMTVEITCPFCRRDFGGRPAKCPFCGMPIPQELRARAAAAQQDERRRREQEKAQKAQFKQAKLQHEQSRAAEATAMTEAVRKNVASLETSSNTRSTSTMRLRSMN